MSGRGGDRGQEKLGAPLAELGGQAVPLPGGEGSVIPRSWPSAGPESPGIGRPRFVLGHRNRALAQRPAELGQPHFLEHPQLPSRAAPPATPNVRPLISGGSGWGSASCRLLRLLRGSPRLCPARRFALSFETRMRAHRFTPYACVLTRPPHPHPKTGSPLRAGTLCLSHSTRSGT